MQLEPPVSRGHLCFSKKSRLNQAAQRPNQKTWHFTTSSFISNCVPLCASIHDRTRCWYQHPAISSPCDESRCVHISESISLGDLIKLLDHSSVQSTVSTENPEEYIFYYLSGGCMQSSFFFFLLLRSKCFHACHQQVETQAYHNRQPYLGSQQHISQKH